MIRKPPFIGDASQGQGLDAEGIKAYMAASRLVSFLDIFDSYRKDQVSSFRTTTHLEVDKTTII